jgi:hypothetical protein
MKKQNYRRRRQTEKRVEMKDRKRDTQRDRRTNRDSQLGYIKET